MTKVTPWLHDIREGARLLVSGEDGWSEKVGKRHERYFVKDDGTGLCRVITVGYYWRKRDWLAAAEVMWPTPIFELPEGTWLPD